MCWLITLLIIDAKLKMYYVSTTWSQESKIKAKTYISMYREPYAKFITENFITVVFQNYLYCSLSCMSGRLTLPNIGTLLKWEKLNGFNKAICREIGLKMNIFHFQPFQNRSPEPNLSTYLKLSYKIGLNKAISREIEQKMSTN